MRKSLACILAILMVLALTVGVSAQSYVFPSTNDLNRDQQTPGHVGKLTPHVNLVEAGADFVILEFVGGYVGYAYFEYRIDGEVLTSGTAHQIVTGDFEYPGIGVPANQIITETFNPDSKIEVRLALGGERDWDFDWVTFNVLPKIVYRAAPAVANDLLNDAEVQSRYGKGKEGGNFIANVSQRMGPGTDFMGVPMTNAREYECAIAKFLNDPDENDGYIAGVSTDACLDQFEFLETVQVPSRNEAGITTLNPLENGQLYLLKASGTYTYNNAGDWADAEWYLKNGVIVKGDTEGSVPYVLDVSIDGYVQNMDWGDYNSDHEYEYEFTGTGSTVRFFIHDSAYGDNNGYITVDIYKVNW